MWVLKYTGQFKKDLKRYQNKPKKIENLMRVLTILQETGSVPEEYYPHWKPFRALQKVVCQSVFMVGKKLPLPDRGTVQANYFFSKYMTKS